MLSALLFVVALQSVQSVRAEEKAPCPIEAARYVLRADPSITAQFHSVQRTETWTAGVALEMRFGTTGRTYWWLPTEGGTADNHGFLWTALKGTPQAAPGSGYNLGDLLYFAFDGDYTMRNESARRGQSAPGHFFLYNMREAFWYRTPYDRRETVDRSLFDLAGCASESDRKAAQPDIVFPFVP